jgi:methylated-DNA-protein-cysteine methyltransferase related protein
MAVCGAIMERSVGPREFSQSVISVIKRIPRGRVATYGMIATLAGNPRGARQVVRLLHTRSKADRLPWHRVINASGRIALKPGQGLELQRAMLIAEGVEVGPSGQVNLSRFLWRPRVR